MGIEVHSAWLTTGDIVAAKLEHASVSDTVTYVLHTIAGYKSIEDEKKLEDVMQKGPDVMQFAITAGKIGIMPVEIYGQTTYHVEFHKGT